MACHVSIYVAWAHSIDLNIPFNDLLFVTQYSSEVINSNFRDSITTFRPSFFIIISISDSLNKLSHQFIKLSSTKFRISKFIFQFFTQSGNFTGHRANKNYFSRIRDILQYGISQIDGSIEILDSDICTVANVHCATSSLNSSPFLATPALLIKTSMVLYFSATIFTKCYMLFLSLTSSCSA